MRAIVRCLGIIVGVLCLSATASAQSNENPDYVLSVGNAISAQGGSVTLPVNLDNSGGNVQGWSFGICGDVTQVVVESAALGATTQTVKFGNPPDFEQINLEPGGWTMGVVICFTACAILPPGLGYEVAIANYTVLAPAETNVAVCPCSTLGSPPINAVVVVNGQSIPPVKVCGNIQVQSLVQFVRADTNADGFLDLSDGIWILNHLFQGGPKFDCNGANDANGDGGLDTADAIYIVLYYFAGGFPPPAPFPTCGYMPNQTLVDCQIFPDCP
jgi:hypothetical protein